MPKEVSPEVTVLQERLKEKMSQAGISVHALEKQAGLKRSAVQNILHGRSKNPSVQILHAAAKILNCDINELLGNASSDISPSARLAPTKTLSDETPLNMALYLQAVQVATEVFNALPSVPPSSQALTYIQEIYQYALEAGQSMIDKNFALWLAHKTL